MNNWSRSAFTSLRTQPRNSASRRDEPKFHHNVCLVEVLGSVLLRLYKRRQPQLVRAVLVAKHLGFLYLTCKLAQEQVQRRSANREYLLHLRWPDHHDASGFSNPVQNITINREAIARVAILDLDSHGMANSWNRVGYNHPASLAVRRQLRNCCTPAQHQKS